MMRRFLLLATLAFSVVAATAVPDFQSGTRYHIVCQQFPAGCVADGASAGKSTPVTYLQNYTTDAATFWQITAAGGGRYYIQNAATGQYVTYDGVREGDTRRYMNVVDEPDGDRSLWTFHPQGTGTYAIRNVSQTDHLWDVRVSSLVVGTYSRTATANQNQLFSFVDDQGNGVADVFESSNPMTVALDDLLIGQSAPVFTTLQGGCMLQSLDAARFGGDVTQTVSYTLHDGWGPLTIDGTAVESGSDYTFASVTGGKSYRLTVSRADGTTATCLLTFTSLAVVSMYGEFSNEYSLGSIVVQEPDKENYLRQQIKAKWRGGITNGADKHKRNYHVKFLDADGQKLDQRFFGLRNDNSWILESCQVDMSRIRNRMITNLWNDFSVRPYYADREAKALTGTRGDFVELVLNDEYRGIYCLTEAMDRKQMKLAKYDETSGTVHGQLWKSKDWSYAVFMGHNLDNNSYPGTSPVAFRNSSESWDQYYVKYPDFDDVNPTDWHILYDAVNFVCTSSNVTFASQVADYFDLPLVIDYYILMETILSTDNHGKNMYFAVYDQQTDKKITFGVWDMDATMGQRWSDVYYHSTLMKPEQSYTTYITNNEHGDYNLFRRLRLTAAADFNMQVRLRYRDLRQTFLQTDSIIGRFSRQLAAFKLCGADKREYSRWSGDTDVAGKTLNFDTELSYLKDWITRRMNYLDNTQFRISELPSAAIGTVTADAAVTEKTVKGVFTLDGRRLSDEADWQLLRRLPAGIYIVNGRKVAVGR